MIRLNLVVVWLFTLLLAAPCVQAQSQPNVRVKAWGWNSSGQVGNGTTHNVPLPVELNLQDVVALAGGMNSVWR